MQVLYKIFIAEELPTFSLAKYKHYKITNIHRRNKTWPKA